MSQWKTTHISLTVVVQPTLLFSPFFSLFVVVSASYVHYFLIFHLCFIGRSVFTFSCRLFHMFCVNTPRASASSWLSGVRRRGFLEVLSRSGPLPTVATLSQHTPHFRNTFANFSKPALNSRSTYATVAKRAKIFATFCNTIFFDSSTNMFRNTFRSKRKYF